MPAQVSSPLCFRPASLAPLVPLRQLASDLLMLCKPTLTAMNILVMLGAYALAGGAFDPGVLLPLLLGTTLLIASANSMNQVLERDSDGLMDRTAQRPLPAGRMEVGTAAAFSFATLVAALPPLWRVHPAVAALGVAAWIAYVCVYTPLKQRSSLALLVGAVPGAVPPLLGWMAAQGGLAPEAWMLFALLVAWQLPHFIGIALLQAEDYARAGIITVVATHGERAVRVRAVFWSVVLLCCSLALVATPLAGWAYGVVAAGLGIWLSWLAALGLRAGAGRDCTRRFFLGSLVYLPALTLALVLDAVLL